MKIQVKLINLSELETIIKAKLKDNWEHERARHGTENLLAYIMENGFPKFDKNNLKVFVNGLAGIMWMETVAVDFGDFEFYWLVSGADAMLLFKKEVEIIQ